MTYSTQGLYFGHMASNVSPVCKLAKRVAGRPRRAATQRNTVLLGAVFLTGRMDPDGMSKPDLRKLSFELWYQCYQILKCLARSTQDHHGQLELLKRLLIRKVIVHRYKNIEMVLGCM